MRAIWQRLAVVIGVLLVTPALASSQTITAVWDPNPPADQVLNYEVCISRTSLTCDVTRATVPAGQTSYTFSPAPGVLYFVAVRAISGAGPSSYSAEVRVSIPGFSALPNRTSTVNIPITPVTITAGDPDGGTVTYSHTGLPFGLTLNSATGVVSGTPTTAGSYNVTVLANDGVATTSGAFVWTIQSGASDTTAPALSISSHTNNQTVTTASITLAGTATDSGAGGSGVTSVMVNGSAATGGTASGSNTASWSRAVTLVGGANLLTVIATDGAGNSRTSSVTVNLSTPDTTAPSVSVTSHVNGQTVTTSSITLAGTATDSGAGGSGISRVTINGTQATGGTTTGSNATTWSGSVALVAGANAITVVATDGAGNSRQVSLTINRSVVDTTAPTLAITNLTNGQAVSTATITLSGTATDNGTGGSGITSVTVNGSAASGGTASGSNTANWSRTLILAAGSNAINVVARDGANNLRTVPVTIVYSPLSLSLSANLSSPQTTGTSVTFSATAAGGTGSYQFKWWLWNGATWTMVRDWGAATYTWTPMQAGANYRMGVWARDTSITADSGQFNLSIPYAVSGAASGWLSVGLTSNLPAPQITGTPVTFTATATGGTGSYQFKWWLWNGVTWTMVRDWGTATYTWTPTQASSNYRLGIWARDASSTADSGQYNVSIPYAVGAPGQLFLGVTTSVPVPKPVGTSITFTATAAGGTGSYQFKWWLWNGVTWTMVRDWGTATYTWTPSSANPYYRIGIWARDASTSADTGQFNLSIPVPITP